jgi:hypothetical protein
MRRWVGVAVLAAIVAVACSSSTQWSDIVCHGSLDATCTGDAPEAAGTCPPVIPRDAVVLPSCGGWNALQGAEGVCGYDPASGRLAWGFSWGIDRPPVCTGAPARLPRTCLEPWGANRANPVPPHPWYCESLPDASDEHAPCASNAECNGGTVCSFADDASAEGTCEKPAPFQGSLF